MFLWGIVGLLAAFCVVLVSATVLDSWLKFFGGWVVGCIGIATSIGSIGQTVLFQSLWNVEIAILLLAVFIVLGFLLLYPNISEEKAKKCVSSFFKENHEGVPFVIEDDKTRMIGIWTWYFAERQSIFGTFWIKIHSKTGKIRGYHLT